MYIIPALRPRRSWSIPKALSIKFIRFLIAGFGWRCVICNGAVRPLGMTKLMATFYSQSHQGVALRDPQRLRLGKDVLGIYIEGAPSSLITGKLKVWAEQAGVAPARIPGYWVHHKEGKEIAMGRAPSSDEKVLLFLHGGGYVALSAHPSEQTSRIPTQIMRACPSMHRSFAVEYRLASMPPKPQAGAFPTQLLDALAGYWYLINTVGYKPEQVVLVGDSAGGNLALALTRYLVEYGSEVPQLPVVPGALVLLSPWVDMSGSWSGPGSSTYTNLDADYLGSFAIKPPRPYMPSAPRGFIAPFGIDFTSQTPYISPACRTLEDVSFKGFPRTFIAVGSAELLFDQIRGFQGRMKASLGEENVVYFEAKDAVHDYMCLLFMEPETSQTVDLISKFLESRSTLATNVLLAQKTKL